MIRIRINLHPLLVAFIVSSLCVNYLQPSKATGQSLTNAIHRTQAATERVNDLWCYECETLEHGESCIDVASHNRSNFVKKCKGEEFTCMVKRFSYTTSNENSTSLPKMWSLDRRCTVNCEPGCIIIGERTKLYACTSCCEKSLCNNGRGGAMKTFDHIEKAAEIFCFTIGVYLTERLHAKQYFIWLVS